MSDVDPLDELRAAWRELPTPDAEHAAADPTEEAVVDWLRDAWASLEPPAVGVAPLTATRSLARASRWSARGTRLAWASVGLVAAGLLALWLVLAQRPSSAPVEIAQVPEPAPPDIEIELITPERTEMRAGAVRLVLVNEWKQDAR